MTTVPVYHFGILKGYLLGQNAPAEVLLAADALHMAAIQGSLRDDALEAIRLITEAAEKLSARAEKVLVDRQPVGKEVHANRTNEIRLMTPDLQALAAESKAPEEPKEIEPPSLTRMGLDKVSDGSDAVPQSDEDKVEAFLKAKKVIVCPPAHATGNDQEPIDGNLQPKKRKEWSPEARAAAAERMRAMRAGGIIKGRKKGVVHAKEPVVHPPKTIIVKHDGLNNADAEPDVAEESIDDQGEMVPISAPVIAERWKPEPLTPDDWPDIKKLLASGHSRGKIAGDYDVRVKDLDAFVEEQVALARQFYEGDKTPGEGRAPSR